MVQKDEGNEFEPSFNQNYIIKRNNQLFRMIARNPYIEQPQVTRERLKRKRIDNEEELRKQLEKFIIDLCNIKEQQ